MAEIINKDVKTIEVKYAEREIIIGDLHIQIIRYIVNGVYRYNTKGEHYIVVRKDIGGRITKDYGYFSIYMSPTGNCQLKSIAYMNMLLQIPERKQVMEEILKTYKDTMFLIDIISEDENNLMKLIKSNNIIIKTPYKSTRGTNMILFLIKMNDCLL
jgi:hypothetical protein